MNKGKSSLINSRKTMFTVKEGKDFKMLSERPRKLEFILTEGM